MKPLKHVEKLERLESEVNELKKRLFVLETKPKFTNGDSVEYTTSCLTYLGGYCGTLKVIGNPCVSKYTNDEFYYEYYLLNKNNNIIRSLECNLKLVK